MITGKVTTDKTPGGIPTYVAVDPKLASSASSTMRKLPEMVAFLEDLYGPYPFETVGGIVDYAPELGYSLESQTKPVFASSPDELTLLHELSRREGRYGLATLCLGGGGSVAMAFERV